METKSLFIEFMGDSPTIRVLYYLLTERDLDFSITDIAKNSGIGRATSTTDKPTKWYQRLLGR